MSRRAAVVRYAIRAALRPDYRRFRRRLEEPALSQTRLLAALTRDLARTEYGASLAVRGTESYPELAARAPIVTYEELRPWIERQASTRRPVMTAEPVVLFQETSGSSGPRKLIPYTRALLASCDRLFRLWLCDLLDNGPVLETGRTFLSISPPVRGPRRTPSGVPIGFDDDTRYLSGLSRFLFDSRFIVVPGLGRVRSIELYRRVLAARLLAERHLEIIFIWSPTYLGALLDLVQEQRATLLQDLQRGLVMAEGFPVPLGRRPDLETVLGGAGPVDWARVWPRLKLISCWTDAAAGLFVERLRRTFPGVMIQGKGLLSAEAPITLPLCRAPAPVPLLDEVFLEFESDDGGIHRLHELREGGEYVLVVSQKAGLVRYRTDDRIQVVGRHRATPCLRFLGRGRNVSDLVGEKLHERFVREALGRLRGGPSEFTILIPVPCREGASYYLCLTDGAVDGGALERELAAAFQYRQARALGQLGPVRVLVRRDARERYTRHFMARGMKWGDIKYEALIGAMSDSELAALTE